MIVQWKQGKYSIFCFEQTTLSLFEQFFPVIMPSKTISVLYFCYFPLAKYLLYHLNIQYMYFNHQGFLLTLIRTKFWMLIEINNSIFINIDIYAPLQGSFYVRLQEEMNHTKKGLIKICKWCYVGLLNPVSKNPNTPTNLDKQFFKTQIVKRLHFPYLQDFNVKFIYCSLDLKDIGHDHYVCIKVFCRFMSKIIKWLSAVLVKINNY